jgi:hypothetical protein
MNFRILFVVGLSGLLGALQTQSNSFAQEVDRKSLREALAFHAPFDGSADAVVQRGDGRVYTTESLARKEWTPGIQRLDVSIVKGAGVRGDCIRFADKSPKVICYKGEVLPRYEQKISGTVGFWMRLDPDKDLKPGYCDPIQITEKTWNDAAMFVDFDKDLPRDFRLGMFSDLKYWNPDNVASTSLYDILALLRIGLAELGFSMLSLPQNLFQNTLPPLAVALISSGISHTMLRTIVPTRHAPIFHKFVL